MTRAVTDALRMANPVPAKEASPDRELLARIVELPRERDAYNYPRRYRRWAVLLAALIVVGLGISAASKFAPRYFGPQDSDSIPAQALAQLRYQPDAEVDAAGLVRMASFDAENGEASIYAAPSRSGVGFCDLTTIGDDLSGWACSGDPAGKAVPSFTNRSSDWGGIVVLLGPLQAPATKIELRFEDGASRSASTRGPWWVYVVGGEETEPGHRPVEVVALDSAGTPVGSERLEPDRFSPDG